VGLHWIVHYLYFLKVIQDDIFLKSLEKWKEHDQLDDVANFVGERLFHQMSFDTALAIAGDHQVVSFKESVLVRKFPPSQESRGGRLHRSGDRSGDRGRSRPSW
jgi:hypothetical protein